MKVSVFTITCNRLELTKQYLKGLKENSPNIDFNHIVIDNGSTDETCKWLYDNDFSYIKIKENVGIFQAMKIAIDYLIKNDNPDLIIKFDNDCKILTDNILERIIKFYKSGCKSFVTAPFDVAIPTDLMPKLRNKSFENGENVIFSNHVGGIFKVMPIAIAKKLLTTTEKEAGGDLLRGRFFLKHGYNSLYFKDLLIEHKGIGNQTKDYKL